MAVPPTYLPGATPSDAQFGKWWFSLRGCSLLVMLIFQGRLFGVFQLRPVAVSDISFIPIASILIIGL